MNRKKLLAVIISLVLAIAVVLPGTLAISADQDSSQSTLSVDTEPTPSEPEPPADPEPSAPGEQPADETPEPPAEEPTAPTECTCGASDGAPHQEGCPLYTAPEAPVCTCDPQPAEGEPHQEGCPFYVAPVAGNLFQELYDKLMLTTSMEEFKSICAGYTDDEIAQFEQWVVENALLDSFENHISAITPAPEEPVTVVFTDAGPFMPPVEVDDSGSSN